MQTHEFESLQKKREQLVHIKSFLGVRDSWHEPDESGISAEIIGDHLDNAIGDETSKWGDGHQEFVVIIRQDSQRFPQNEQERGKEVFRINLANLLAIASNRW